MTAVFRKVRDDIRTSQKRGVLGCLRAVVYGDFAPAGVFFGPRTRFEECRCLSGLQIQPRTDHRFGLPSAGRAAVYGGGPASREDCAELALREQLVKIERDADV